MQETLRLLGISNEMIGTRLLERLMNREISISELTDRQINDILEAWDTRNIVPNSRKEYVDRVRPIVTDEEDQSEYNREYVQIIGKYLNVITL